MELLSETSRLKDLEYEIRRLNFIIEIGDGHKRKLNRKIQELCRHIDQIENFLYHFVWALKEKELLVKSKEFRKKLACIAKQINTPLRPWPYRPEKHRVRCCTCGQDFSISYTPGIYVMCPGCGDDTTFWIDKYKSPSVRGNLKKKDRSPTIPM
jgi:hypothetical protein